jgi:serine/threonine protein kinase
MAAVGDIGAGHTLGRYELLVPIAQGGMAVVWAARMRGTRGFQKIVAIKSMLPQLSDDPQFEEMFLAEAGLASRIKHPNVCEIQDLGEEAGTLYIVMEWVDGEPLSTIQKVARKTGGMPLSIATRIALHAASGLHAAHELKGDEGELVGVVHRDVSPQNILVTHDGVVKIVDFGVAKATAHAEENHTKAGQVKGKVPFMSPEQALGRSVDRRTDVFALGIVLYQLVTGQHPFRGDNDLVTMNRICSAAPAESPRNYVAELPQGLFDVITTALAKNQDDRFQTMHEMARALERALAELVAGGDDVDLGTFIREKVGDRGEKRKASIKDALRLADLRSPPRSMTGTSIPAFVDVPTATSSLPGEVSGERLINGERLSRPSFASGVSLQTPAHATETASAVPLTAPAEAPPPAKKGGLVIALVAAAALALGVGGVLVLRGNSAPAAQPPPPAPTAAEVAPAPTAEPAATVAEPAATAVSSAAPSASAEAAPIDINSLPEAHASTKPNSGGSPVMKPTATPAKTAKPTSTVKGPTVRDPGF